MEKNVPQQALRRKHFFSLFFLENRIAMWLTGRWQSSQQNRWPLSSYMDQLSPHPSCRGHHGDPSKNLLFPLELALPKIRIFSIYEPQEHHCCRFERKQKRKFWTYLQSLLLWEKAIQLQKPRNRERPQNEEKLLFLALPVNWKLLQPGSQS